MKTRAYRDLVKRQREYFRAGATLSVGFRREQFQVFREGDKICNCLPCKK